MSYYDFHWRQRGGKLSEDLYIAEKTKVILDIIPKECATIVDVGCGDGAITNVLAEKHKVIGLDLSKVALKHLSAKTSPITGSADYLPFKDKSIDMVLSSELLEHLPNEVLTRAISEIKRISKKYVLISVPNKEKLRRRYTKCNSCGFEFHIYGHLRSFNLSKLARYFDGYAVKYSTLCGALEEKSFDVIYYLKNKLANSYFFVSTVFISCPNCGNVLSFPLKRNLLQKLVSFSLTMLQRTLNFLLNRKPEPDWLLVLFEKT
jgi:ubiquinone/menaquinone biosynthesis C-methylase UbiE